MVVKPPYQISSKALNLVAKIANLLGKKEVYLSIKPEINLRKENRIKTIQGSLAIEGNSLSLEQVSAILEDKKVIGPQKDIVEVQNAIVLYEKLHELNYQSIKSLEKAHKILMQGLIKDAGKFRAGNVGILKGDKVSHIAPKPGLVPKLMKELFEYLKKNKEENLLIQSCVLHYELEFIHPFMDGNGRIGRFWQSLMLYNYDPIFEYIPIESLVKVKQKEYYKALEKSDKAGESTVFIEFMLEVILESLEEFLEQYKPSAVTAETRIEKAREKFFDREFDRKEYMSLFKNISSATASRDLKLAVDKGLLGKSGEKRTTSYIFKA